MRNIILVFFSLALSSAFSQERATVERLNKERKERKAFAEKSILELKNGALLVRLDFDNRKVEYFEKYDNHKEANKIKEKAAKVNKEVIDAFRTYYNFSEVYFFAMSDSRKLLEGKLDSVLFYTDEAKADSSIRPSHEHFFIAEFGYIEQDTSTFYSGSTPSTNDESNPEGKTYYGGSKNGRSALVIRDLKFNQLRDPFPYFSTYNILGSVKKRYRLPVKKMNEKLLNYHSKVGGQ